MRNVSCFRPVEICKLLLNLDEIVIIAVLNLRARGAELEIPMATQLLQKSFADAAGAVEGQEVTRGEVENGVVPARLGDEETVVCAGNVHGLFEVAIESRLILHGSSPGLVVLEPFREHIIGVHVGCFLVSHAQAGAV
jgi:hypothetical protein